jgi:plasmid stability protein
MSIEALTIHLPEGLYQRLQRRARESQRSLEAELLDVLSNAVRADESLPETLAINLAHLDRMTDAELWQAARMRQPKREAAQLERLHLKRQRNEGLSEAEAGVLEELVGKYERLMLVRARAAALLKERGHDPADLAAEP